jgi:hypothetical protein
VARRMCDLENLVNEEAIARVGLQHHVKKKIHREILRLVKSDAVKSHKMQIKIFTCVIYTFRQILIKLYTKTKHKNFTELKLTS